ncbi:uncharacterized protein LOC143465144 [Clavelina lepadiformis]|uniref:uncharacterized protein LOC143465144 n=1 Tax=Clavelina lepadiformis TaxID=159417 RepID=UPI004041F033
MEVSSSKHSTEEELKLTKELRKNCDNKGKEKNPFKSASIFHQMALIYWERSKQVHYMTRKLHLIRSATLFNAALSRHSSNGELEKDLQKFCADLLKCANAKNFDVDLLGITKNVEKLISKMRKEAKKDLQALTNISYDVKKDEQRKLEIQKIEKMKTVQIKITQMYNNMMKFIAEQCEITMGEPPCKYAIAGMGSLARCEITPYSDFEHIILLEEGAQEKEIYQEVLEYFRWFSVIFHVIVLNLQETIVPCVGIPSLIDESKKDGSSWFYDVHTKCGISFDGMKPYACKMPLGRIEKTEKKSWTTELIKPVSKMLRYLDSDEDLKNGYHLADILMKHCFVFGDKSIYEAFADGVRVTLHQGKNSHHETLMKQLEENLQNVDAFRSLHALRRSSQCDIKRVVYRSTTLFISALGRLHGIDEGSSFVIINQLKINKIIDDETSHLLSYAIAVSCQVRLTVYMEKESQNDNVGEDQFYDEWNNKVFTKLVGIVGERSLVNYFAIAKKFQQNLRCEEKLQDRKFSLVLEPVDKFEMLYMLQLYDRVISDWESFLQEKTQIVSFHDESWMRYRVAKSHYYKHQYSNSLHLWEWIEINSDDSVLKKEVMRYKARCLYDSGHLHETLQFIAQVRPEIESLNLSESRSYRIRTDLSFISGCCKQNLAQYHEAIKDYKQSIVYRNYIDQRDFPLKEIQRAECCYRIGWCLYKLGDYDEAINESKTSLRHGEKHNAPLNKMCECYKLLGLCHMNKGEYQKSVELFHKEIALRGQFVPREKQDSDENMKDAKINVEACQESLK